MLNSFGLGGGGGGKPVYVAGIKVEASITPKGLAVTATLEVKEVSVSVQVS